MQSVYWKIRLVLCSLILILASCASETNPDTDAGTDVSSANDPNSSNPSNSPKTAEYRVIELYADLDANPSVLDGTWESECKALTSNSSYYRSKRIYHLNGVFQELAIYNDVNCAIKSSQNSVRLFGTVDNIETIQLFNGLDSIEVQQITSVFMAAPIRGRPIPLQFLTLDDLTSHSTAYETFSIVENRLYVSDKTDPELIDLLADQKTYLVNDNININQKSETEIDIQATELFDPSNL